MTGRSDHPMRLISAWTPPDDWLRVDTLDAHTAGEPLRVFTLDLPELSSGTMSERRAWMMEQGDSFRRLLMWEPRGHREMYGCIVTPPEREGSDVGVLFLHNEGFSTMCGHGIIAIATVLVETGVVPRKGPAASIRIDTPAGLVIAEASLAAGRVSSIAFENVPSFVEHSGIRLDVPELGQIMGDVAFGGAYYVFVDAEQLGLSCGPDDAGALVSAGRAITKTASAAVDLAHPDDERLNFIYGTIFVEPSAEEGIHSRNVCIFADGQVDRSPTGTGVSARLAIHAARGDIEIGERITIESIIGTRFEGVAVRKTRCGAFDAVVPRVSGQAYITGRHSFVVDPNDPLSKGFLI